MAKTKLNMIDLVNEAWEYRYKYTSESYTNLCQKLLSSAYIKIDKDYDNYCIKNNIKNEEIVFVIFQRVIISFMLTDGDFHQEEYDAYCNFCDCANIKPLTMQRCREIYNIMDVITIAQFVSKLIKSRETVDPNEWKKMILGFCCLCLMGDKAMDEDEYYILRCFFEDGFDYKPKSWENFKREWV